MRWQRKRARAACTHYWVLCQQHAGTGPVHGRRLAHGLRVLSRGLQRRGETGRTDGGGPRRFVESFCKFTDALLVGFPPSGMLVTFATRVCCVAGSCFPLEPGVRSGDASLDPNSAVALGGAADRTAAAEEAFTRERPCDECASAGARCCSRPHSWSPQASATPHCAGLVRTQRIRSHSSRCLQMLSTMSAFATGVYWRLPLCAGRRH